MTVPTDQQPPDQPPPDYKVYRSRPRLFKGRGGDGKALDDLRRKGPAPPGGGKRKITVGRVVKWLALAVAGWLVLSLVVFLISAQIQQGQVDVKLGGAGNPLVSPNNILVLGSDTRSAGTAEPGAQTTGPGRSDSIMLMRVGGGANSRLSIARDTLVDIPGRGRQKINAAYAIGGVNLAVETVEAYTGVEINHVILVSFDDFPDLIDAMGGIDYRGGCVVSKVNGGYANGGVTVRIRAGQEKHLNGDQALALARTRKNACNSRESDLTRARRQQRIVSAMKDRITSPAAFVRLPFISWQIPRTFKTDMNGPTLLGVFASMALAGEPETQVLGTLSGVVDQADKERAVKRFERG